jgi:hypothetical protein
MLPSVDIQVSLKRSIGEREFLDECPIARLHDLYRLATPRSPILFTICFHDLGSIRFGETMLA